MPSSAPGWIDWLREPIVVFALIGVGLFALDAWVVGGDKGSREIIVSDHRIEALRADFETRENRPPSPRELDVMVDHWVTNEALYQQARALGLDQDDLIIRRQLIRKMRFLLEDTHPLPEPSREALQRQLEAHPERYGQAATFSFDHAFITRGEEARARAEKLLAELRAGGVSTDTPPGDPFPGPARMSAADATTIHKRFGRPFLDALPELPHGTWSGPIASRIGLHLVRVQAASPFQPATVETAGKQLRNDVRQAQRAQKNAELLDALRAQFVVQRSPSPP